ncbi:hypothetical protein Aros01_09364 [Streptosporangium roseum]
MISLIHVWLTGPVRIAVSVVMNRWGLAVRGQRWVRYSGCE